MEGHNSAHNKHLKFFSEHSFVPASVIGIYALVFPHHDPELLYWLFTWSATLIYRLFTGWSVEISWQGTSFLSHLPYFSAAVLQPWPHPWPRGPHTQPCCMLCALGVRVPVPFLQTLGQEGIFCKWGKWNTGSQVTSTGATPACDTAIILISDSSPAPLFLPHTVPSRWWEPIGIEIMLFWLRLEPMSWDLNWT